MCMSLISSTDQGIRSRPFECQKRPLFTVFLRIPMIFRFLSNLDDKNNVLRSYSRFRRKLTRKHACAVKILDPKETSSRVPRESGARK